MPAAVHGERLLIDPRLHRAIDRLEEVVAVVLQMEAEQIVAEQTVEHLGLPRHDAERLGIGPRDVPELTDDGIGPRRFHEPRQQRVVIVLHEHDRARAGNLLEHDVGKAPVDGDVLPPVALIEDRPRVGDVAQRPERVVGDAVVVAVLFLRLQPHAAQRVLRLVGRNREPARRIRRFEIAAPIAVRHPRAAARLHHRIERRHQSARRLLPVDAYLVALTQNPSSQPAADR